MPTDTLTLGGVQFDDYSTPSHMGAGGKQAMRVHKLPGGARVIDTLGPDDDNISWAGEFFGNNSDGNIQTLDAMRIAGQVLSLTFAGQYRLVIIDSFVYKWRRFPVWAEYAISCVVYQNPNAGVLGGVSSTIDSLIISDLSFAIGL